MNHDEESPVPGLRDLSMQREPERDLWPGIAARMAPRRVRLSRPMLAAAACALLSLTAMLSLRVAQDPRAQGTFAAAASPNTPARRVTDLRASRALIKANLRIARSAESQLRKALRQAPDDTSLRSLLDSTHQQRRELDQLLLADST